MPVWTSSTGPPPTRFARRAKATILVTLSHNMLRAAGAVLTAELLESVGYLATK